MNSKKIVLAAFVVFLAATPAIAASPLEPASLSPALAQLRNKAKTGDYDAQRNLAFTYSTGGMDLNGKKYPVAGCAWYLALSQMNASKIHAGDAGNVKVYCNRLELDDLRSALVYSSELTGLAAKR
ncbi:hypothetical protein [Variovorax gossypii]